MDDLMCAFNKKNQLSGKVEIKMEGFVCMCVFSPNDSGTLR